MKLPRLTDLQVGLKTTLFIAVALLSMSACNWRFGDEPEVAAAPPPPAPKAPTTVPTWLGSPSRNFPGTGPWSNEPLQVVWEFKTGMIAGRLHKDPWGGTSWPGQPSVDEEHVYFGSAASYLYCLNKHDGSLVWRFKTEDSLKSTPTIVGDRLLAS